MLPLSSEIDTHSETYQALFEREEPLERILGQGGYGTVYKIKDLNLAAKICFFNNLRGHKLPEGEFPRPIELEYEEGRIRIDGEKRNLNLRQRSYLRRQVIARGALQYIQREGKGEEALNHICSLVGDYFICPKGNLGIILVEEYIPGKRFLNENPKKFQTKDKRQMPLNAAYVIDQLAKVLALFERLGILHCDIKPGNVLQSEATKQKKSKTTLLDFDTVEFTKKGRKDLTDEVLKIILEEENYYQKKINLLLGTAAYMSPERVLGKKAEPSSDFYSLGLTLAEYCTGNLINNERTSHSAMYKAAFNTKRIRERAVRLLKKRNFEQEFIGALSLLLLRQPKRRDLNPLLELAQERIKLFQDSVGIEEPLVKNKNLIARSIIRIAQMFKRT